MYTVEIYRADKRTKTGERLIFKDDYHTNTLKDLMSTFHSNLNQGERFEIHATMVDKIDMFTGEVFEERYDCPSPISKGSWGTDPWSKYEN